MVITLAMLMFLVPVASREYETCDSPATTKRFHLIRGEKDAFDNASKTPNYTQLLCTPTTHKAQLYIL